MNITELREMNLMRKTFLQDEEGIGTVELVLILVVLIGLVVIFRNSITSLLQTLFAKINGEALGL